MGRAAAPQFDNFFARYRKTHRLPRGWIALTAGLVAASAIVLVASAAHSALARLDTRADTRWSRIGSAQQHQTRVLNDLIGFVQRAAVPAQVSAIAPVVEAKERLAAATPAGPPSDRAALERYLDAQRGLEGALEGFWPAIEQSRHHRAAAYLSTLREHSLQLQRMLAAERNSYDEAAAAFNVRRERPPASWVAAIASERFGEKPRFDAR